MSLRLRACFSEQYSAAVPPVRRLIERRVIGGDRGANGYVTMAEADVLARHLRISAADSLLDMGTGRGWPGLHLAVRTGCRTVVTDCRSTGSEPPPAGRLPTGLLHAPQQSSRPPARFASGTAASTSSSIPTCCVGCGRSSPCCGRAAAGWAHGLHTILGSPGLAPAARRRGERSLAQRVRGRVGAAPTPCAHEIGANLGHRWHDRP